MSLLALMALMALMALLAAIGVIALVPYLVLQLKGLGITANDIYRGALECRAPNTRVTRLAFAGTGHRTRRAVF